MVAPVLHSQRCNDYMHLRVAIHIGTLLTIRYLSDMNTECVTSIMHYESHAGFQNHQ